MNNTKLKWLALIVSLVLSAACGIVCIVFAQGAEDPEWHYRIATSLFGFVGGGALVSILAIKGRNALSPLVVGPAVGLGMMLGLGGCGSKPPPINPACVVECVAPVIPCLITCVDNPEACEHSPDP